MVEPAFRSLLATDPTITTLVGDRVYQQVKPQDAPSPCIVLTRVSTFRIRQINGVIGGTRGRMQVDAFAPTYRGAKELAALIHSRLDRFTGSVAGTKFHWIEADDERDLPSAPLEGQAVPTFAVSSDYQFLHDN